MMGALRAATIALLATAVCVATPDRLGAQDLACDRGDKEVRGLEFRGNRALSDDDLALRVTTTPSSWGRRHLHLWFAERRCLNPFELPKDVMSLQGYYEQRGYYSAKVDTLIQPMGRDAVRVIFLINEGAPTRLASYRITGLEGIADSANIMRRIRLKVGAPFDRSLYRADLDTIVSRLREAGYYRANAAIGWDRDTTTATASITVIPGKRARFGEPDFDITPLDARGQQLKTEVVRRVMGIAQGDQYSDHAIVDAQRNLFQLGTYRHIEVTPLPDSAQPPGDTIVKLAVRLTEDYMRQLDSEFGWATLDCGRVRLQYTDKNLLGTARRFELTGQASKIGFGEPLASPSTRDLCALAGPLKADSEFSSKLHYYTGIAVRQPRLLGTRWVPAMSLYSERRGEFKAYLRSTQVGGDFSATRDVGDRMPLRLGYSLEYGKTDAPDAAFCALFNRCDPQSRAVLAKLATLGVASTTLARFRTDNLINPARGTAMRGEVRTSASRFLGTSDSLFFTKGTGDVAWYRPFGWRNVLALRVRAGAVVGRRLTLSDSGVFIPPQERLYAGGPTSVRGFQQNELGSLVYIARRSDIDTIAVTSGGTTKYRLQIKDKSGPERVVPLGGNSLLVTNLEYRIRDPFLFPDLLQYTLFLDGGDVWSNRRGRLKWTPGIGLRALTPVGPVQVNVGFNQYDRELGSIYYNPDVTTLQCVSPNNQVLYTKNASNQFVLDTDAPCERNFRPPRREKFFQRLTFTFSIGPDF